MHVVTTHDRSQLAPICLVALAGLIVVATATEVWGATGTMIAAVLTLCGLAAVADTRSGRIPNLLVAAAGLPTMAVVIASGAAGSACGYLQLMIGDCDAIFDENVIHSLFQIQ